jgi:hypothetical protein
MVSPKRPLDKNVMAKTRHLRLSYWFIRGISEMLRQRNPRELQRRKFWLT